MRFVIQFTDNENYAHKRQELMQEHLRFLEKNADMILAAGPIFDIASQEAAGGLWIVETPSVDDVQALVEQDPFFPTGLRKDVRILEWDLVFEQGKCVQ